MKTGVDGTTTLGHRTKKSAPKRAVSIAIIRDRDDQEAGILPALLN
jgi:hypothetical protein